MDKIDIRIERASSLAAGRLIAALDQDIVGRYPGMAVNGIDVAGFEADGGVFAIGYVDGEPAMCGAFRRYKGTAEIKRMFVVPAFRGCGLGRRMLRFLEDEAARLCPRHPRDRQEAGRGDFVYSSSGWATISATRR
jgi:GNAT superfamily N-acetyltransferase